MHCEKINETTLWQRRMMGDQPECRGSFLPMLNGTAGGKGEDSLPSDPVELTKMLKDMQHLQGYDRVMNMRVSESP